MGRTCVCTRVRGRCLHVLYFCVCVRACACTAHTTRADSQPPSAPSRLPLVPLSTPATSAQRYNLCQHSVPAPVVCPLRPRPPPPPCLLALGVRYGTAVQLCVAACIACSGPGTGVARRRGAGVRNGAWRDVRCCFVLLCCFCCASCTPRAPCGAVSRGRAHVSVHASPSSRVRACVRAPECRPLCGSEHNPGRVATCPRCTLLACVRSCVYACACPCACALTTQVGLNEVVITSEVAPFGGVKASGLGREQSKYGLAEFQVGRAGGLQGRGGGRAL